MFWIYVQALQKKGVDQRSETIGTLSVRCVYNTRSEEMERYYCNLSTRKLKLKCRSYKAIELCKKGV
ncbi:hypothetical protein KHA80_21185 [Anaerobacillus sp. HL2]|nr:hypothetical protein KHA80_21185 [Anaerobacillus sp. HL2]